MGQGVLDENQIGVDLVSPDGQFVAVTQSACYWVGRLLQQGTNGHHPTTSPQATRKAYSATEQPYYRVLLIRHRFVIMCVYIYVSTINNKHPASTVIWDNDIIYHLYMYDIIVSQMWAKLRYRKTRQTSNYIQISENTVNKIRWI